MPPSPKSSSALEGVAVCRARHAPADESAVQDPRAGKTWARPVDRAILARIGDMAEEHALHRSFDVNVTSMLSIILLVKRRPDEDCVSEFLCARSVPLVRKPPNSA